ncbi:MAG: hypothetical protein ACRDX8_15070 [Acidimicrobiales bacterium]
MALAQVAPRVRQADAGRRALVVRRSTVGMLVGLVVQFCVNVIPAGAAQAG